MHVASDDASDDVSVMMRVMMRIKSVMMGSDLSLQRQSAAPICH